MSEPRKDIENLFENLFKICCYLGLLFSVVFVITAAVKMAWNLF